MAKKKARKKSKKTTVKAGKKAKKRKIVRARKKIRKVKAVGKAKIKEKKLGVIDHFFGGISVAAIKVKAPIKVGDVIHIQGHTTDFVQKVESMQIEHQNVMKAKRGDDIGIKVKEKVRQHDVVYLASSEREAAAPKPVSPPTSTSEAKKSKESASYSEVKFLKF